MGDTLVAGGVGSVADHDAVRQHQAPGLVSGEGARQPGIAANIVAPGAIETDFLGGVVRDMPDLNQQFAAMTALGRVGLPDDIGPMVASLLGPDNHGVNGQRTEVSGGQTI